MGGKWCGKQCFPLFGKQRKTERMENPGENFPPGPTNFFPPDYCGEKAALNVKLHKCPLPPTLLTNTTAVLESSKKKKKKPETKSWRKKKERKHFLNEGEKERKEGGDKEIRKNVYGGRRKKKPERASWRR